jgi:hypothetical protein
MGSSIKELPIREERKKNYYQCNVKRLFLSNFIRIPNEAPSLFAESSRYESGVPGSISIAIILLQRKLF